MIGKAEDPIPVQRALQDGAMDITVVFTHRLGLRFKPKPHWLGKLAYPEFPNVARAWTELQCLKYNAALDLIQQPPTGVRLRVFSPLRPLAIGPLTIEQEQIDAALALGHDEAQEQTVATDAKCQDTGV